VWRSNRRRSWRTSRELDMSPWALMRLASALCMRLVRPACRVLVGGGKGPPVCLDGNAKRCVCARQPPCNEGGGGLGGKALRGPNSQAMQNGWFWSRSADCPCGSPALPSSALGSPSTYPLGAPRAWRVPARFAHVAASSLLPAERLHAPVPPRGSQLGGFPMLPRYALPGGAYTKLVWELGPT
jgi:hypothetical protein